VFCFFGAGCFIGAIMNSISASLASYSIDAPNAATITPARQCGIGRHFVQQRHAKTLKQAHRHSANVACNNFAAILEANAMRFKKFAFGIDGDGDHWSECYDRGVRLRQYGTSRIRSIFALLRI